MKLNSSQNIMNVYPIVSFINKENFHLFGSFSFIKINILVVGYDSYMDFIRSIGLVLSIKINFIHGYRLLGVMFYPSTHIFVCKSIQWFLQLIACKMNTIESILCFWNMYQTNKLHKDMLKVMTKGPWPHQTSRNSQNSNNGLKATLLPCEPMNVNGKRVSVNYEHVSSTPWIKINLL